MTEFVKCGKCGTVYDMHGTHGTTVIKGYCPMCGLHHSGTHSIAYPVLKPSPLAAKPISILERTCHDTGVRYPGWTCSECGHVSSYALNYCPKCGAKVVE